MKTRCLRFERVFTLCDHRYAQIVALMRTEWQKQLAEENRQREARRRYEKAQQALWSPNNSTAEGSR